jgi:hypothetical protein
MVEIYVHMPPKRRRIAIASGHKGGTNRAKNLTAKQRSAIARKGALARWKKDAR